MEKKVIFGLIFLFLFVRVLAQEGDWNSFGDGDGGEDFNNPATDEPLDDVNVDDSQDFTDDTDNTEFKEYTSNFYLALGVLGVGVIIIIFFIYLFLKTPKPDWEN